MKKVSSYALSKLGKKIIKKVLNLTFDCTKKLDQKKTWNKDSKRPIITRNSSVCKKWCVLDNNKKLNRIYFNEENKNLS